MCYLMAAIVEKDAILNYNFGQLQKLFETPNTTYKFEIT